MDYGCLQGDGLDWPPMEERNLFNSASAFGSFQHTAYNPPYPPLSWGTTDPSLLQTNEHAQWLNRGKIPSAGNMHDNLGVDTGGHLTHQRPNIVAKINPFNMTSNRTTPAISSDSWSMMMAAISSDLSSSFSGDAAAHAQWMQMCSLSSDEYLNDAMPDFSFSFGGDTVAHAQRVQMCSLSSDGYLNDAMPQLISDLAAQQPYSACTSSSDCLHEADSSGSSERDRPLSRSPLVGSSSDEMSWGNSDPLQGNLGGSLLGFHLDGLPDDSSSILADPDTLDSGRHAFSCLASMPEPAVGCVPTGPVSWTSTPSTVKSGNGSTVSNVFNQNVPNLDTMIQSGYDGTSSNESQPYKRQRASYASETTTIGPLSPALNPSLSKTISNSISGSVPGMSAYQMTSSNVTAALYKDFHMPKGQTLSLPQPGVSAAVGGFATKGDQLLDTDPRSQRKQNATSIEPQSVAARHRRKKISERVRVLEKLIPGRNKMDTASMLDESIEYVKFLQLQVQLLESLPVDTSEGSSTVSTAPFYKENLWGEKDGLDARAGSFGSSHASQSCTTMQQVRLPASPLILSEILQQQLFKQKLCLVSLRQYSPGHSMHDIRD